MKVLHELPLHLDQTAPMQPEQAADFHEYMCLIGYVGVTEDFWRSAGEVSRETCKELLKSRNFTKCRAEQICCREVGHKDCAARETC